MSKTMRFGLALAATFWASAASAAETLQVTFRDQPRGSPIRPVNAGCVAAAADRAEPGPKRSDGPHGGYGGPCPPWNDERIHHSRIMVYALDVPSLKLPLGFTEADLLAAARGHSLASGFIEAPYSLNPKARP